MEQRRLLIHTERPTHKGHTNLFVWRIVGAAAADGRYFHRHISRLHIRVHALYSSTTIHVGVHEETAYFSSVGWENTQLKYNDRSQCQQTRETQVVTVRS